MDFNFVRLRLEFAIKLLDRVALLGYDAILWELENQVRWGSCPECAVPDAWSECFKTVRKWLHFNLDLEDNYIRKHCESLK